MNLIERLREPGTLDSRGTFTLDSKKAREKMARFQLTDPLRYVLEVVQAAVALGAPAVDVALGAGVEVAFGGTPLPEEGLATLDDYLLASPEDPQEYALRALAMACAALATLKAERIRLESPAGFFLERAGGADTLGRGSFERNRLLAEGLRRPRGGSEEALLRAECPWAPVPVRLAGQDLRSPPELDALGPLLEEQHGEARLRAAVARQWHASQVSIVSRGVVVSRREVVLPAPVVAVVWHDRLARNASHSDVVEDKRYQDLLRLLEGASNRCLDALAGLQGAREEPARALLLHQVRHRLESKAGLSQALERAPVLRDTRGKPLSLQDLEEQKARLGSVPATEEPLPGDPGDLRVVRVETPVQRALLQARFGPALQDAREHVLKALRRTRNIEQWEANPRPPTLPLGEWLARRPVAGPGFRGEVGLEARDVDPGSVVHVLYRGRLLQTRPLAPPLSFVAVLDFQDLEIDDEWTGPVEGKGWRRAVEILREQAAKLADDLVARADTPEGRAHLLLALEAEGRKSKSALRSVPLFEDLAGGRWSVAQLEALKGGIRLVSRKVEGFPPELPPEALPRDPILRVATRDREVLQALFGNRVADWSSNLEGLEQLAERFRVRRAPAVEGDFPVKVAFARDGLRGELGLLPSEEGRGRVTLLREGVLLEERGVKPALGIPFLAALDSPRLTPRPGWTGVENDKGWNEAVAALREAETEARVRFLEAWAREPRAEWRGTVMRCLAQEPVLASTVSRAPLVPATVGLASLEAVKEEARRHGSVLTLPPGSGRTLPGRLVLEDGPELEALRPLLEGVTLESAATLVEREDAAEAFFRRPSRDVGTGILHPLESRALEPPRKGEVALVAPGAGGFLAVFHQGRPLEKVLGELPPSVAAALEDPTVQPSPLYSSVVRDGAWRSALEALAGDVGRLAEEVAMGVRPATPKAAALLALAGWPALPEESRVVVEQASLLLLQPDRLASLAQLRALLGDRPRLPVIRPGTPGTPLDGRPVLVADRDLAERVSALVRRPVEDDGPALARDRQRAETLRRAARTKARMPRCLVELEVQGTHLRGRLGVPVSPRARQLVVRRDGVVVGTLDMPGHPSCGILEGDFHLDALGQLQNPSREVRRELREHQVELYGRLVQEYPGLGAPTRGLGDRALADRLLLAFASEERSSLGGTNRTAEVLEALLALPLLRAAGGRRASPAALVAEARGGRVVEFYARPVLAFPSSEAVLPILPARSPERVLCERLLGEARLKELEAPTVRERLARAGAAVGRAYGELTGWLGGVLKRMGEVPVPRLPEAKPRRKPAAAEEKKKAPPRPDDPDEALLRALRREFSVVARGRLRRHMGRTLEGMRRFVLPLGPPARFREGVLEVNTFHPAVAYARDHLDTDPAALSALLAHLVCLVNHHLDSVDAKDEMAFLVDLAQGLRQSF